MKKKPEPCPLCNKPPPPRGGCSHVDCPSRKHTLHAPTAPGFYNPAGYRVLPKSHPGKVLACATISPINDQLEKRHEKAYILRLPSPLHTHSAP